MECYCTVSSVYTIVYTLTIQEFEGHEELKPLFKSIKLAYIKPGGKVVLAKWCMQNWFKTHGIHSQHFWLFIQL